MDSNPKHGGVNHRERLLKLASDAPHKKNGSPQFPNEGLTAHSVHTGRGGSNRIDQKAAASIGAAMLQALAAGELELVSVSPAEFNNPAKLAEVNAAIESGIARVVNCTTGQIAEEGKSRVENVSFIFKGGPTPSLIVEFKVP